MVFERAFAEADIVSLHCPLTKTTERMVNVERLRQMKRGAFLINTSRGPLLDEYAVAIQNIKAFLQGNPLNVVS